MVQRRSAEGRVLPSSLLTHGTAADIRFPADERVMGEYTTSYVSAGRQPDKNQVLVYERLNCGPECIENGFCYNLINGLS